jgi:hypothetical protein
MALQTIGVLGDQTPDYVPVPDKPRQEAVELAGAFPFGPPINAAAAVNVGAVYGRPYTPVVVGFDLPQQSGQVSSAAAVWDVVQELAAQFVLDKALQPTYARLDDFLGLKENWYFHGARRISPATVNLAKQLLSTLRVLPYGDLGKNVIPFAVGPLVTGGIQLEWKGDLGNLELEVKPDGTLHYLLVSRQGPEEERGAEPQEFLDLLRRIL